MADLIATITKERRWWPVLLASVEYGTGEDIFKLIAMLSAPPCFEFPADREQKRSAIQKIRESYGFLASDHLMLIEIFNEFFFHYERVHRYSNFEPKLSEFCRVNFLNRHALEAAIEIWNYLKLIWTECGYPITTFDQKDSVQYGEQIFKTLIAGFPNSIAKMSPKLHRIPKWIVGENHGDTMAVKIHYASTLFGIEPQPAYVFYTGLAKGYSPPVLRFVTDLGQQLPSWVPETPWSKTMRDWESQNTGQHKRVLLGPLPSILRRGTRILEREISTVYPVRSMCFPIEYGGEFALITFNGGNLAGVFVNNIENGELIKGFRLHAELV